MTTTYIHLPMLEILLADRFSTSRSLSDARGARFVILFPERSSLSRFIHSPMHPRSYISKKIYLKKKQKKNHIHKLSVTGTTDYIYFKIKTTTKYYLDSLA